MSDLTEVYRPDARDFELGPYQDRVLELVRLFERGAVVRLRVAGTIAAGAPIEATPEPEEVELHGPAESARCHRALGGLRRYLCPALESGARDAFEVARVITPLLAGLRISGKVPIDLDPWLFAGVSLLIARMGVAAFCAGDSEDGEGAGDADTDAGKDADGAPAANVAGVAGAADAADVGIVAASMGIGAVPGGAGGQGATRPGREAALGHRHGRGHGHGHGDGRARRATDAERG